MSSHSQLNLVAEVFFRTFCIETPRTGSRLLQTEDKELLKLAKNVMGVSIFHIRYGAYLVNFGVLGISPFERFEQ